MSNQSASELIASALFSRRDLVTDAITAAFQQLDITGVAAVLRCSTQTVRNRPSLMALARTIEGVGNRWDASEVNDWIKGHPRAVRAARVTITDN